ncbi:MAG: hypothetical protein C0506_15040 [Anaerolinea sp.]|nr:hypothetical protein [Anaerolinea sp.]
MSNCRPHFAPWIARTWGFETASLEDVGLLHAKDSAIFTQAGRAGAILVTKDGDFSLMARARRTGAKIVWLRCGNVSNARLKQILTSTLPAAVERIEARESVVEIWA